MSLLDHIKADIAKDENAEVNELAALLRYSQVPTLIVEGASDARIYSRWIEQRLLGTYKVDVLNAKGRDNLLNLYERRNEFVHAPVIFIVDQKMWLFLEKIPKAFSDIICTQGYSIENDVYATSGVENLLDPTRAWEHWLVRESIIRWFAFEVEGYLAGMLPEVNIRLDNLVPKGNTEVEKAFLDRRGFRWPGTQITEKISDEYRFNLPGKLLFEMVARFSNIPLHGLYNVALAEYESPERKLIQKIKDKLGKQNSISSKKILSEQKTVKLVQHVQGIRNSVRDSKNKSEVNTPYSSARKLVANLKPYTPTVIIERENDNRFDWWIYQLAERLKPRMINQLGEHPKILSIIERDEFLSIYERKIEFEDVPIVFIGNREMWLFERIPEDYENIIWTQGYGLENDLYAEADLERLLQPHETWKHRQVRNSVIEWFAFEVEEFLAGKRERIDIDFGLSDIVPEGELGLDKGFCQRRGFHQPPSERVQQIKERYEYRLPGKFLFQILIRFLNTRGRDFNFNVNEHSLYDIALTMYDSQLPLNALIKKIEGKLDIEEKRIAETNPAIYQRRKVESRKDYRAAPKSTTKPQRKPKSKQNQKWESQNSQPSKPSQLLGKLGIKLGDKVSAIILKKDGIKVTVQLQTDNKEEIVFEQPYYPGKVGDKVKLKVIGTNDTGRVSKVVP